MTVIGFAFAKAKHLTINLQHTIRSIKPIYDACLFLKKALGDVETNLRCLPLENNFLL